MTIVKDLPLANNDDMKKEVVVVKLSLTSNLQTFYSSLHYAFLSKDATVLPRQ